jgi:small-conductance mechanosensitive channel
MDAEHLMTLLKGPLGQWAVAGGIATLIILAAALFKYLLLKRLSALAKRTRTKLDDAVVEAVQATRIMLVVLIAVYIGSQSLELPAQSGKILRSVATVALFLQMGLWGKQLLQFWIGHSRTRAMASNASAATSLSAFGFIAQTLLWTLVLLLILDNLGINITALVTGLGIGGVAVALAVQNILGDLFASLSIVVDKPFVIGDFIIVDDYMGTVENVGLKTTRIRSLNGEQIVFSNSDLLKTRVRNYKRMYERRVLFNIDVVYETPPEQLEKVPALVRKIVESQQKIRFERAHFSAFAESALRFEVVYWVLDPDFNLYMDIQQSINLALMRALARENVRFAYPATTIRVEGPVRLEGLAELSETVPRARPQASSAAAPAATRHSGVS